MKLRNTKFLVLISIWCTFAMNAYAAQLTKDELNEYISTKLGIPVFYTLPESSYASISNINPVDATLINFKHPESKSAATSLGLRIYSHKPDGTLASSLAASGFIKTGDILLSFRPEWGGAGPYTNIQMGISHAGVAYIKNGVVNNIDMPLSSEYLGEINSEHYRETKAIHVIRPRGLTDKQKNNVAEWASRLVSVSSQIYPKKISFNQDYTSPNYQPGKPLTFVKQLGQLALGIPGNISLKMYCSEFAWSLLSLRDCDPDVAQVFKEDGIPSCINPIFTPLHMSGDFVGAKRPETSHVGLSDGPLLTINAMGLGNTGRDRLLTSVFATNKEKNAKLSPGHKKVSDLMSPVFDKLQEVYLGAFYNIQQTTELRVLFNVKMKDNYSPPSFVLLTLPPKESTSRVMDYVGTVTYIEQ